MKRFWSAARVIPTGIAFGVALDGKQMRLPGGSALAVPFAALANGIAAEWNAVEDVFVPADLPLTQLAGTAIERISPQPGAVLDALIRYGMNDLLCYHAADPALAAREENAWAPWRRWAAAELGVELRTTSGVLPTAQPPEAATRFEAYLQKMDEFQLAGLGAIVPALGSLVLGLAVAAGALPPEAACEAAQFEETWQEERWGTDAAAAARRRVILKEVADADHFMMLCRL